MNTRLLLLLGTVTLCLWRLVAQGPAVFRATDFGASPDGATDAAPGIRQAIAAATAAGPGAEVRLEAGTYRLLPPAPGQSCLTIAGATNLTLRGSGPGTRLVVGDPTAGGFLFTGSQDVSLAGVSIDYDPPPFCQGTVTAIDTAGGSFELEVEPGFPTPDEPQFLRALEPYGKWGMIMDRATRRIRAGTPDHFMTPRWEHVEGRRWRFFTADEHHRRNLGHLRVGDAYVHLARNHGSAVLAQGCDGVRLESLVVHAAPGLAVGLVGNRGSVVVRRIEVRFPAGTRRLLTTNADGIHGQQNRSGPVIEDCYFEGMADDAINFYAPPNVLLEVLEPRRWRVSAATLILPGDRLQVIEPATGRVRGEVKAVEVVPARGAFTITLDRPVPDARAGADHRSADTLYNLDACGAGFQIRRNRMAGNRRYGCLLRAGRGVVEDNTFEDTTGAGVVLTNEPDWPEGPLPWDIVIRRNRFIRGGTCAGYADSPGGAMLVVRASRLGHGLGDPGGLQNIRIENNDFIDPAGAAVFVGGATGVIVSSNRISAAETASRLRPGPALLVERSSGVALSDNRLQDPRPATSAGLEIAADVPAGDGGVRVERFSTSLAPGSLPVRDQRR